MTLTKWKFNLVLCLGIPLMIAAGAGHSSQGQQSECLLNVTGLNGQDELAQWIRSTPQGELKKAIYACTLSNYQKRRSAQGEEASLCEIIEPSDDLSQAERYLLASLSGLEPDKSRDIKNAIRDGRLTDTERARICNRALETGATGPYE